MSPREIFADVEIQPGHRVLDFGCGPGLFSIMAAEKTGPSGRVYALDIHPLAIKMLKKKARRKNLENITAIESGCRSSIPDHSLDLVLFFDVFHMLDNKGEVLKELHRVLKPDGIVCFSDHHMKEERILSGWNDSGLFVLQRRGKKTFSFATSASGKTGVGEQTGILQRNP
jgi:ubiquinone/menaquinone biosynthesis C-methylase UbiE